MTTVPVDLHRDLQAQDQRRQGQLSGVWTASLLALAGVAVAAFWIAAFFMGLPYLAHLGR